MSASTQPLDLNTYRFLRGKKQRTSMIAATYGRRSVDALVDHLLALRSQDEPARTPVAQAEVEAADQVPAVAEGSTSVARVFTFSAEAAALGELASSGFPERQTEGLPSLAEPAVRAVDATTKRSGRPRTIVALVSEEQLRRLLVDDGLTFQQVADSLGTTRSAISGLAGRYRIVKGQQPKEPECPSDEVVRAAPDKPAPRRTKTSRIIEMWEQGETDRRKIAAAVGTTLASVHAAIWQHRQKHQGSEGAGISCPPPPTDSTASSPNTADTVSAVNQGRASADIQQEQQHEHAERAQEGAGGEVPNGGSDRPVGAARRHVRRAEREGARGREGQRRPSLPAVRPARDAGLIGVEGSERHRQDAAAPAELACMPPAPVGPGGECGPDADAAPQVATSSDPWRLCGTLPMAEVVALYNSGSSAKRIGRLAGVSHQHVLDRLRKVGSEIAPPTKVFQRVESKPPEPSPPPELPKPAPRPRPSVEPSAGLASFYSHLRAIGPAPRTCQWIEGEPTPDDSCKCGKRAVEGKPYCAAHHARAYVQGPERKRIEKGVEWSAARIVGRTPG